MSLEVVDCESVPHIIAEFTIGKDCRKGIVKDNVILWRDFPSVKVKHQMNRRGM